MDTQISKTVNNEVAMFPAFVVCTSVRQNDLGPESSFMTPRFCQRGGGSGMSSSVAYQPPSIPIANITIYGHQLAQQVQG
jgi:hypothetical protein